MKALVFPLVALLLTWTTPAAAQPPWARPVPAPLAGEDQVERRAAYLARVDEVLAWRAGAADAPGPLLTDLGVIAAKLARREDVGRCSRSVVALMKKAGSGPFWMFPVTSIAYLGRDQLSAEAQASIREAWGQVLQVRGDTENHWVMYYTSLYLMSELYPDEPGQRWYTGKSSAENLAESRGYLIHWMDLTTTVGQGEFNPTHYIGEYAIPMLYLASWAKDPGMRQRGRMMLDWLFADLAENTLNGVLRGANARTDDTSVIERWNALASFFSWLLHGSTPPTVNYGGWGPYFAVAARNYEVPEVIHRIAIDRDADYLQRDLKRTRRRWRNSDVLMAPIYKTSYMRREYAVGSYQGGLADPIQTHVWDVTWAVPDPRGVHNTMFSMHPLSSAADMQTYFTELPDQMVTGVATEGKPSYDAPDKFLGGSRFERVFQDLDTIIALYDIPPGTRFPHINGFFSKDLTDVTEDASGWIFARGGQTFLAYRPLAPYTWERSASWAALDPGDRRLCSPYLKNGTIVQAAGAVEFPSFAAFQAAIRALPLTFRLQPTPSVSFTTLRGKAVVFTYAEAPLVNGVRLDYARWKLFEGPYLNAEKGSRKLTLTHGTLKRVLDFNTLIITDR